MALRAAPPRETLPADAYSRAERLLPDNLKDLAFGLRVIPRWIEGTDRFWYANRTREGMEYVLVDAAAGTRQVETEPPETHASPVMGELPSPDSCWSLFVRDGNLVIRDTATGEERQLTHDAEPDYTYATLPDTMRAKLLLEPFGVTLPPLAIWSPDSTRFVTHRIDERRVPLMPLVQAIPRDGGRPRAHAMHYPMPGDPAAMAEFVVVEVESGTVTPVQLEPVPLLFGSPILFGQVWWKNDGRILYYLRASRGNKDLWLERIDPANGAVQTLVYEGRDSYVDPSPFGARALWLLGDDAEIVWWSEHDGWGHLYLLAGGSGEVTRQLTSGSWLVRELVYVDEAERIAYFTAGGREPGSDPYVRGFYRVHLDTMEIEQLTHDDLDHEVSASPSGRYFLDHASRWDVPPVTTVLDRSGNAVVEVQRADIEQLLAAGWRHPERFSVKGADGQTDIYGLLYRPLDLDESASYPILDDVYPGPQANRAWAQFQGSLIFTDEMSFAALGFAVVTIDGRGTPLRSREFHDYSYGRLGVAGGLDDHVAAIRQLAARYPWLDADRVGVYGHSAGGYASVRAILAYPDFYTVAVSSAGDHDPAHDLASWIEKYGGPLDAETFADQSNLTLAGNLQGKLLLIAGDIDEVVPLDQTLRLVQALIRENKDFDLLIIPNLDHWLYENKPYWLRRRWDYFVDHLMGLQPPRGYRIKDIPLDASLIARMFGG